MAAIETISQIMTTLWWVVKWFWWAFLICWLFYLKIRWAKFPLEVIIYEKRGENIVQTNDRAGRYNDPYTKTIGYKLQKAKDRIPIVDFEAVIHRNMLHTTIFERFVNLLRPTAGAIHLFRYGSKQYKPIKIKTANGVTLKYEEVKGEDGQPVYVNIYKSLDPRSKLGVLDFEVVDWDNMNMMVQEFQITNERRKKQSEFWKQIVIPAIIIGATVIFSIVMIKFGYDYASSLASSAPVAKAPAEKPNIPIIGDLLPGT